MPDSQRQPAHFEPLHDAHAIEQVAFIFQVDRPLTEQKFLRARTAAENASADLPGRAEIQGIRFSIGANPSGPVPTGPAIGNIFTRTRPDNIVESELKIDRNSVTYRTLLYTRWDEVWSNARRYFDAIIPNYVGLGKISGISINFVDKFIWTGTPSDCRPSELLRHGSRYVCPYVFDENDLWHSHTGAFMRADRHTKRLLNINVDYLEETQQEGLRRTVAVTTVVTDLLNQVGYEPLEASENTVVEVFDCQMLELHRFGKMVFGNVINDDMCRRIALID